MNLHSNMCALGLSLAMFAVSAQGATTLTISDGVTSVAVTNASGTAAYSGAFDTVWTVVVSAGQTKPSLGSAGNPTNDLSIQATCQGSSPAPDLTITLSNNGFGPTAGNFLAQLNGHMLSGVGQTVAYSTYYDVGNLIGAMTSPLTTASGLTSPFNSAVVSGLFEQGLYSLTQVVTIKGSPSGQSATYSLDAALVFLPTVPRPILAFGSAHPWTTNGLDLSLQGVPGISYRVLAATNLVNWLPLTNLTSTNAVMFFRDASATNASRRFYRAVAP